MLSFIILKIETYKRVFCAKKCAFLVITKDKKEFIRACDLFAEYLTLNKDKDINRCFECLRYEGNYLYYLYLYLISYWLFIKRVLRFD